MSGTRCAVNGCNNTYSINKGREDDDKLIMHAFPKSKNLVSRTIRKEWQRRCCRTHEFNPDTSRICSDHFVDSDYKRDLEHELLGLPPRKKLKKTAVPTVGLMKDISKIPEITCDEDDTESIRDENSDEEIVSEKPILRNVSDIQKHKAQNILQNVNSISPSTSGTSHPTYIKMDAYKKLLKKHIQLKSEYKQMIQNLRKKNRSLIEHIRYLKTRSFPKLINVQKNAQKMLKKLLTDNQIASLSNKKESVVWTREEISLAFTLRYYSKNCYLYLKNQLLYPLPSLSTLKNWALKLNVSEGILKDILLMLKLAGEKLSDFEKTVVLQFGGEKVKPLEEYDTSKDEVIGPHSRIEVVMARGLFSEWKQPVYIDFDQRMTKQILVDIITELHEISYNVVACVSDCGASNVSLWNDLGVDIDCSSFAHPVTDRNIYMFADTPHLFMLIRNGLIDKGFVLEDGSIINKAPLQALIELTKVNRSWEIDQTHLDCEGSQRQNIKSTAQLLSNSVSKGLLRYKPGTDKKMAEKLGHFIYDINYWFDIFNSYTTSGKVSTRRAYGLDIINQMSHLNKMINTVTSMRVVGKNTLQIFQKGMIMSMNSLINLYSDLKADLGITYICTHRLNQASLENFFLQLQSKDGADEHPSPLLAIHRIRMVMLGKNPALFASNVNADEKMLDEYIVTKVLETANIQMGEIPSNMNPMSSSSTDFSFTSEEITDDALEYIAGYLANKYKDTLPQLGQATYKIKPEYNYTILSWVQKLSYGGLIKPAEHWFDKIKKWNLYFEFHHGEALKTGPGVSKKLANKIFKKDHELPLDILKDFCQIRTIIRLTFRNLKSKHINIKRGNDDSDTTRKVNKKMKTIK